jgi:cytochrome d ubiquinol oxidase subunit II
MATKGREGWAFIGTFATIALAVAGLFWVLFPAVMPASNDAALSLMAGHNPAQGISAASSQYTLTVMTWVAVIFTPIVLIYQAWTYWVFRKRIATHHIPAVDVPEGLSV